MTYMTYIKHAIFLISISFFTSFSLHAQTATEALRYASFNDLVTARNAGFGGAMSGLGADFSSISSNPAGLAWFRKSILQVTPVISNFNTTSLLTNEKDNRSVSDNTGDFNLGSLGIVATNYRASRKLKTFNFGVGINSISAFDEKFSFEGHSKGSIVNRFLEQANDIGLSTFESQLAYDAGGLLYSEADNLYSSDFDVAPEALTFKEQTVSTQGGINEFDLSLAFNVEEKVLIGISLGLASVDFQEEKLYKETDDGEGKHGNVPTFDALSYTETLRTEGGGVNLKLGAIYRINQIVRMGIAFHSPTKYDLTDSYHSEMTYDYTLDNETNAGSASSPDGSFSYSLKTPWRIIGSAGAVIGKRAAIGVEIEYEDYATSSFDFNSYLDAENEANKDIEDELAAALGINLGGEVSLNNFKLRAGVQAKQSPLEGDNTFSTGFSVGAGFRWEAFFFDAAFRKGSQKKSYTPYNTSEGYEQIVDKDVFSNNVYLTLGFRF